MPEKAELAKHISREAFLVIYSYFDENYELILRSGSNYIYYKQNSYAISNQDPVQQTAKAINLALWMT